MDDYIETVFFPSYSAILDDSGREVLSDDALAINAYLSDESARTLNKTSVLGYEVATVHFGYSSEALGCNYKTTIYSSSQDEHPTMQTLCNALRREEMDKMEATLHHHAAVHYVSSLMFAPYGRSWRTAKKLFNVSGAHNKQGRHLATSYRNQLKQVRSTHA